MITEDRLTAFALEEVDAVERSAIAAHLAVDADARRFVAETRTLAAALTASLAAEAMPLLATPSLPARPVPPNRSRLWAALAASVILATGLGVYGYQENYSPSAMASREHSKDRERASIAIVDPGLDTNFKAAIAVDTKTSVPYNVATTAVLASAVVPKDAAKAPVPLVILPGTPTPVGIAHGVTDGITLNPTGTTTPTGGTLTLSSPPSLAVPLIPGRNNNLAHGPNATFFGGLSGGVPAKGVKGDDLREEKAGDKRSTKNEPTSGAELSRKQQLERGVANRFAEQGHSYDRFPALVENDFVKVDGLNALSTFGVDVDTASYSLVRKFLDQNTLPPAGAVRLEEMVNYFPYRDAAPSGPEPYAVTVEMAECPWAPKNKLARIGLKAKPIDYANRPASNLVFLVDVSGSMAPENRLPLVKKSLKLLVDQLTENDRVALVTYASGTGVALESTPATDKSKILHALDHLQSGGSTNGAGGIHLAYQVAVANFITGGTNRVILCTDGDFNVGTSSTDELVKLIEEKRKSNVFLSVFGYGMGNLRDEMFVQLAGKGNGNYAYIDTIKEARKALVEQLGGTLVTVAKDVKIQVEFNPTKVGAYRLLGYEKRKLAAEDFHNDAKDAGEMGAGHVVTALYELTPAGESPVAGVDALRYQAAPRNVNENQEAFVVKLRHKLPESDTSTLREVPVTDVTKKYGEASEDFRFAAAVASFSMLLRDSPYKGNATYAAVIELATAAKSWDPGAYRAEFIEMVGKAKSVAGKP